MMKLKFSKGMRQLIHKWWGHYFLISTRRGVACSCGEEKEISGGGFSSTGDGWRTAQIQSDGSFIIKGLGTITMYIPEDVRRLHERKFRIGRFLGVY